MSRKDLKAARLALGESQKAFAARFGVNQATIHRWEQRGPSSDGVAKLAFQWVLKEATRISRPKVSACR